jgi:hypothetical protein
MDLDTNYLLQNLKKRILTLFFDIPVTYFGLVISLSILIFSIATPDYLFIILLSVGFVLHVIFLFSLKKKLTTRFIIKVVLDLGIGLGICLISGFWFEIVIVVLTILYLLYYATMVTVSYQQLSFTNQDTIDELNKRHKAKLPKKK